MTDADWSDGGFFLENLGVHPTLVPLDVHHSFKSLLGDWLTTERINVQHDVTEFARYLLSKLQPAAFDKDDVVAEVVTFEWTSYGSKSG